MLSSHRSFVIYQLAIFIKYHGKAFAVYQFPHVTNHSHIYIHESASGQGETNWVTQTNLMIQTITNVANQVVTTTNTVTNIVPQIMTLTNYTFAPNPTLTNTVESAAGLAGPVGTAVGYGLAGLLGIWAFLKNKQANTLATVAGVSQQALATAQQVISALPNGPALLAQFNAWLAAHQNDVDFAKELAQTVENFVDQTQAQHAAAGIVSLAQPAPAPMPAPAKT